MKSLTKHHTIAEGKLAGSMGIASFPKLLKTQAGLDELQFSWMNWSRDDDIPIFHEIFIGIANSYTTSKRHNYAFAT